MATPGIIYFVGSPATTVPIEKFNSIYSQHIKDRLSLPSGLFKDCTRYKLQNEENYFLTVYNITDLSGLQGPEYQNLAKSASEEEKELLTTGLQYSERKVFQQVDSKTSDTIPDAETKPGALLVTTTAVFPKSDLAEYESWISKEHFPLISRVPGFRRARAFRPVGPANEALQDDEVEVLTMYDYEEENGLSGPEFKAVFEGEWTKVVRGRFRSGVRRVGNFMVELKREG